MDYGRLIILMAATAIVTSCAGISPPPMTMPIEFAAPLSQLPPSLPPSPMVDGIDGNKVYRTISDTPEYIVGPEDVLEIVFRHRIEERLHTAVVRPDGTISILFLDDLEVSGLTAGQIDVLITREITRFIKDPRVDVRVKEYNSKKASLFGEINVLQTGVSGPGNYPLKGKNTLIDLLVTAGGAKTQSDLKNVKLIRDGKTYTLNLYQAMFEGDIQHNVILDDKDVVIIPELSTLSDTVMVLGEVSTPGVHPFKHQIDVASAISLAGGYLPDAAEESTMVVQRDPADPQNSRVLRINLKKLFKKGILTENIRLQSGDIVYVPRSYIADVSRFAQQLRTILDVLLLPGIYRDIYTTGGGLRIDTGFPKTRAVSPGPVITVPVGGGR